MTINLNTVSREFLFVLIVIYFSQGTFYAAGSVVGKISLLLMFLVSFLYLAKTLIIESKKAAFYYMWSALFFLNFIGFFLEGVVGEGFDGKQYSQMRNIITAMLPFFAFYYLAYKGFLSKEHLLRFFIILVPVAIAGFYSNRSDILSESLDDTENVVTNTAYFFAALIPYVFLWGRRKVFSIISLLLLLFFIIQGAKRGALIVSIAGALVFAYYQLTTFDPKKRIQSLIISITGILLLIWFSYDFYISNEFLMNRIQKIDEGGSGRDFIYSNLWNNWLESNNIFNYLFGFGFVSTIKYSGTGNLAHNDWLELLTNFGLLGIAIYLSLFCAAIRFIFYSNVEREDKLMIIAIIFIWFLKTMFSMYYTVSITVLTSILLGYLFGKYKRNGSMKNRTISAPRNIGENKNAIY